MHRKPEAELLPLDTELERTLINLKKVRSVESVVMAEQQETHQNIPALAIQRPQRQRTMEYFWRLVIRDEYSVVRQPTIEANNLSLSQLLSQWCIYINILVIPMKSLMSIWVDL